MGKNVFVSADWKDHGNPESDDKDVVDRIRKWSDDLRYSTEFRYTDDVKDSVLKPSNPDCRRCDIKGECGDQIDWSSVVIFVVGDKVASKTAGECNGVSCSPAYSGLGTERCKYYKSPAEDVDGGNGMSYLKFEITKAAREGKSILLVFNSVNKMESWIPSWYNTLCKDYIFTELGRVPFWNEVKGTKDCYYDIKGYLM